MLVNSFVSLIFYGVMSLDGASTTVSVDMEYFNSSTLSSLLGLESTTTEKSNADIFNDTIHKVIQTKDMVSLTNGCAGLDF